MNIVIAGKNNIAIDVLEAMKFKYPSFQYYAVFNANDYGVDGFQRSFKKYCSESSIKELTLTEAYCLSNAIFISLEYDKIVNPKSFSHNRVYNIHFSKLPSYKGMYTSAWPIINGESQSGVTFHYIDKGIDTGDIIYQECIAIQKGETAKSLYEKYIVSGTKLIVEHIDEIVAGKLTGKKQDAYDSSYYSRKSIDYSDIDIDLKQTAFEISNKINAFTFRDYQLPEIGGCKVFGCEILGSKSLNSAGTVVDGELYFIISTVDYDLKVYKDVFDDLLLSCREGDLIRTKSLVNQFNVNEKDENGWSPIIVAAYNGQLDIVEYLVSMGADINDSNYKGTTVFMYAKDFALKNNDSNFLEKLVGMGANPELTDLSGLNVFDYVEKTSDAASISFMRKFL
ncbi:formyltransferase family protein [Shewanella halotolerans]|uniref:formyltransferase family protein n=1 Tax=Shewanella halotolerans TaxID=2864204 RepID=UPI001C661646|nr:formyltransferase family protein [Shewanella halotolerans]QYJ88706.1 ankyrin repeat domain-containing protein [Shewanella halotolerans]